MWEWEKSKAIEKIDYARQIFFQYKITPEFLGVCYG